MYSLNWRISITIFSFPIGLAETKIFGFEDFSLEVERSQLVKKSQNRFFLISSLWLIELIETDRIGFGWVELILLNFEDLSLVSD